MHDEEKDFLFLIFIIRKNVFIFLKIKVIIIKYNIQSKSLLINRLIIAPHRNN
jgi:hypothetical protein